MGSPQPPEAPTYRGSSKHKNRPVNEQKGTLCPEWTHTTPAGGFATDVHSHDWQRTEAASLFSTAVIHQESGQRFATAQGVAFKAAPTGDGTWHGYPVPWEAVPAKIKNQWLAGGSVTGRQVRAFLRFDRGDIHWALKTDFR